MGLNEEKIGPKLWYLDFYENLEHFGIMCVNVAIDAFSKCNSLHCNSKKIHVLLTFAQ